MIDPVYLMIKVFETTTKPVIYLLTVTVAGKQYKLNLLPNEYLSHGAVTSAIESASGRVITPLTKESWEEICKTTEYRQVQAPWFLLSKDPKQLKEVSLY